MITTTEKTTITCDKCSKSSTAHNETYNEVFFSEGWGTYPNAKKYQHVCYNCQPKKHQKSHDFVARF